MTGAADETRTRNTLLGRQMLYQLNYCCIIYLKLANLRYIILKLFSINLCVLVNHSRGLRKPWWLQKMVTLQLSLGYEPSEIPFL